MPGPSSEHSGKHFAMRIRDIVSTAQRFSRLISYLDIRKYFWSYQQFSVRKLERIHLLEPHISRFFSLIHCFQRYFLLPDFCLRRRCSCRYQLQMLTFVTFWPGVAESSASARSVSEQAGEGGSPLRADGRARPVGGRRGGQRPIVQGGKHG